MHVDRLGGDRDVAEGVQPGGEGVQELGVGLLVVPAQRGDGTPDGVVPGAGQVVQVHEDRVDRDRSDVGDDRSGRVAAQQCSAGAVGLGARSREGVGAQGRVADPDDHLVAGGHPAGEVGRDRLGPVGSLGLHEAIDDLADDRSLAVRAGGGEVQTEGVGESAELQPSLDPVDALGARATHVERLDGDNADRAALQAEAVEGVGAVGAAKEGGRHEVRTQPALDVGAGPQPQ